MNFSDVIIRPATSKDVDQLYALMLAFAEFDGSKEEFIIREDELESILRNDASKLKSLVVVVDNVVIGFLNYFVSYSSFSLKTCLWVEDVFINDKHRSGGIGQQLFDYVKKCAQDLGCHQLEWLVRRSNVKGIEFYKKLGAKVDQDTIYVSWEI